MKRTRFPFLILATLALANLHAETETIDLKALAKKARPAVLLLVVSDAAGKEIATGTGFLVSSDGKLITNHHVIENAASAVAKAENGGLFPVEGVLADDPKNDLVLLKLKGKDLPFLPLGNSGQIEVGTRIAVVGSPLGLEGTLSEGIVSAVRELTGDLRRLQITAAISPGSSGSPVLEAKGRVIGVASAQSVEGQALNFAVPVEVARVLTANAQHLAMPQQLSRFTESVRGKFLSDPDYKACQAATFSGDDAKCLKHAQALVQRYPENATAYFELGWAYLMLDFTDDAISAFQAAIRLKPDDAEAWWNLARAYEDAERLSDSVAAYRQAVKLQPDDALKWIQLGTALATVEDYSKAIDACRQAIKLDPEDGSFWSILGSTYEKDGRIAEAIGAYRKAINVDSKNKLRISEIPIALTWFSLGRCYEKSGEFAKSIEAFERSLEKYPDNDTAWELLALTCAKSKQFEKARKAVDGLKKLDPEKAKAVSELLRKLSP